MSMSVTIQRLIIGRLKNNKLESLQESGSGLICDISSRHERKRTAEILGNPPLGGAERLGYSLLFYAAYLE
jgi:hypothetical protein